MAIARSLFRSSTTIRNAAASRVASEAKSKAKGACSPFGLPKQHTPLSTRIFRSPVELSCCVELLMPLHTATSSSSALLTSMLSLSRRGYGLLPEAENLLHNPSSNLGTLIYVRRLQLPRISKKNGDPTVWVSRTIFYIYGVLVSRATVNS